MIDSVNFLIGILTVIFGAFGFLAPRYTLAALNLETTTTNMGLSEMRASVGGLFVLFGIYILIFPSSAGFFHLGIAFSGAALGRVISLLRDDPPVRKVLVFGGIEAGMAAWLLLANST